LAKSSMEKETLLALERAGSDFMSINRLKKIVNYGRE
jgi:hypothetical protein